MSLVNTTANRLPASLLILLIGLACAFQAQASEVKLSGDHAINVMADRPEFSQPEYNDESWPRVAVPSSLRSAGLDPRIDVFWYRISFEVPSDWSSDTPAIRLGIIDRADETYLNGMHIGSTGEIGPRESDWHIYPPILPRLYPFNPNLLKVGETNIVAIRVAREPYIDDGGIIVGPVALVDMVDALPDYLLLRQRFLSINYLLLGVETIILLAAIFALYLRPNYRSICLFFLLYTPYYANALERRNLLHLAGLDHPVFQFAANAVGALAFVALISFVAHVFSHPVGRFGRILQISSVLSLITVPLTGVPILTWWNMESALVWHSLLLIGLILLVFWSVKALIQRKPHAMPLVVGLSLLALSMFGDLLSPANHVEATFGFRLAEMGVLALFLSVAFIVGQSMLQTDRALIRANTDVLTAHEQERERLARDIHDSIGQWLTTIKLRLELLGSENSDERSPTTKRVRDIVTDVSHAIEDTRRVAQDLSPVFLEEQGLAAAMRSQADRVARQKPFRVDVDLPSTLQLPNIQRDHLYRVFQEALNNAASHSNASLITVALRQRAGDIVLEISDDGSGISATGKQTRPDKQRSGLGLKTMQDRARLLNGELAVISNDMGGTTVRLRCPMPKTRQET